MNQNFSLNERGVFVEFSRHTDNGPVTELRWISSPIRVTALVSSSTNREWTRLLEVTDQDGTIHRWPMPMEMLAGDSTELRRALLNLGATLENDAFSRSQLVRYLGTSTPDRRITCTRTAGWYDSPRGWRYVLADTAIGGDDVVLVSDASTESNMTCQGTLSDWQTNIGRFFGENTRLVFGACCAFASSLLGVIGAESRGYHFRGASSLGKTTLLVATGSILGGGPRNGFVRSWRSTANGLEATAAISNDSLLLLDELGQLDPQVACEAAYLLCNGMGKRRANQHGEARKSAEWRLIFLSSGELSLGDLLRNANRRFATAGQKVRVIDLDADSGVHGLFENLHGFASASDFANYLKVAAKQHFGTPFREFLRFILSHDREALAAQVRDSIKTFVGKNVPIMCDAQIRRVGEGFGLLAIAGALAQESGILPIGKDEPVTACQKMFANWLQRRGTHGSSEIQQLIAIVEDFFQRNASSRFEILPNPNDCLHDVSNPKRVIHDRAGFRKTEDGGTSFYLFPATFNEEICRGNFDPAWAKRELAERGLLVRSADGRMTEKLKIPGETVRPRFLRFSSTVLGGSEAHDDLV